MGQPLHLDFYRRADVTLIARELLGKVIITRFDGRITAGIITETEAYAGERDRASHAYGGRRTQRTEVMFAAGGVTYVYLCYGMHHLFNVVTNEKDIPHAVLVRAIAPTAGEAVMRERRGGRPLRTGGPALVTQALGIRTAHTGLDLRRGAIRIVDEGRAVSPAEIITGPRIGVDYAGPDALLPYRFRFSP